MTPPALSVDSAGRVHGANVTWNSPWPCSNGENGGMSVPSGVLGVVMHTQVGNNPGTVSWFNNPAAQASAHFCVAQDGSVVQMGPISGWKAWHNAAGCANWYGIEFADNGNPANPLTGAQVDAAAQLVELLSRPTVGRFTLQVSNDTGTEGFGWHGMGGAAWGGHYDCPGDARKAQRPQIVALAEAIRGGGPVPPAPAPPSPSPVPAWETAMLSALPTITTSSNNDDTGLPHWYVHRIQLLANGVFGAALKVDGAYGPATAAAVTKIQGAHGLTADGQVGPATWGLLLTGSPA